MKKLLSIFLLSALVLSACSTEDLPEEINIQLDPDTETEEEISITIDDGMVHSSTSGKTEDTPSVVVTDRNEPTELTPVNNIINFDNIYIGQQVGSMTVTTFDTPGSFSDKFMRWNSEIVFTGEIELSGSYEHLSPDTGFFGERVCITELDASSQAKLPIPSDGYTGHYIFCFDGYIEDVKAKFGSAPGETGQATFTIGQFTFIGLESEVWNGARLI